jgi:acetolactate synthase-1/2/3 large subunit
MGPPRPNEAREAGRPDDPVTQDSAGADYMVDVIKSMNIDFLLTNPASSFRGLHEALVNHGGNTKPELLTCTHEEIAVAMAHGYAKTSGKPLVVMVHGTVGLMHASMAIYNAYCDRAPVIVLGGNTMEADVRQRAEWVHSAQDPVGMVRDYTKWDDQPHTLQGFGESFVRAYQIAMTPPMGPVVLSVDTELQEHPIENRVALRIPKLPSMALPQANEAAVDETARLLVEAETPVLMADRMARNQEGMDLLVELAETLHCAVLDRNGRTNFPSHHPLNQSFRSGALVSQADVVVGLEVNDFWQALNASSDRIVRRSRSMLKPGAKTVHIGAKDLFIKSNFQDFGRYQDVDLSVAGDAQTSLRPLIEAVKRRLDPGKRAAAEARGERYGQLKDTSLERLRETATIGWDSTPITTARLSAELWDQIRDEDWSLVGEGLMPTWRRLWSTDRYYQLNGGSGGWGLGYFAGAALGSALANRDAGRISVCFQGDGDLMFGPGVLWSAAHHKIPLLYLMYNNRAYHQEVMYVQNMAARRSRGMANVHIGTELRNPDIDFAMMAKSMGVYAEGPITDPNDLRPAIRRALAVVKRGEPALIDAVVEPR